MRFPRSATSYVPPFTRDAARNGMIYRFSPEVGIGAERRLLDEVSPRSSFSLAEQRRQTGLRANFDGSIWIAKQTSEILRPICTSLLEIVDHRSNPVRSRKLSKCFLILSLEINVSRVCHRSLPSPIAASNGLCRTQRKFLSVVITAISTGPPQKGAK